MATQFPDNLRAVPELWRRLSVNQRLTLGLAVAATIAGIATLVNFAGRSNFQPLYSQMSQEDAAAVVLRLKEMKSPFELRDGGRTVAVPADKLDELRLEMATGGMPGTGSLGFEIFDRTQLGATGFTENVNMRRALEGELTRTLRTIGEVQSARVHVVMPADRSFGLKRSVAKASVFLNLRPGRQLSPVKVQAIRELVAYAVEELRPEAVVVVDDLGNLLSPSVGEVASSQQSTQEFDEQRRIEEGLENKLLGLLTPLYGHGQFNARVSADVDFSAVQETAELVDPNQTAVLSEQTLEERTLQQQPIGVPGVASNVGNTPDPAPTPSVVDQRPTRLSATRNFEISKTTRQTTGQRATIKRISVAVVVNSGSLEEGAAKADPARVTELVSAAVGLDPSRGDRVGVEFMPFGTDAPVLTPLAAKLDMARGLSQSYGRVAVTVVAALLGYLLFLRPLKRQTVKALSLAGKAALPAARLPAGPSAAEKLAERSDGDVVENSMERDKGIPEPVREAVLKSASADPAATARFIRGWLQESN